MTHVLFWLGPSSIRMEIRAGREPEAEKLIFFIGRTKAMTVSAFFFFRHSVFRKAAGSQGSSASQNQATAFCGIPGSPSCKASEAPSCGPADLPEAAGCCVPGRQRRYEQLQTLPHSQPATEPSTQLYAGTSTNQEPGQPTPIILTLPPWPLACNICSAGICSQVTPLPREH